MPFFQLKDWDNEWCFNDNEDGFDVPSATENFGNNL